MEVPNKGPFYIKKHIRKVFVKRKGRWAVLKAFSLAKSLSTGNSKSFFFVTNKKEKVGII